MALAMAQALAAGQSISLGTSQSPAAITSHPGQDPAPTSSHNQQQHGTQRDQVLEMIQQLRRDFQASTESILKALSTMDSRMSRAETSLKQVEQRLTQKLDTMQDSISSLAPAHTIEG